MSLMINLSLMVLAIHYYTLNACILLICSITIYTKTPNVSLRRFIIYVSKTSESNVLTFNKAFINFVFLDINCKTSRKTLLNE